MLRSSNEYKDVSKRAHHPELDMPTLSEMDGVRYLHFGSPWIQGAMQISHPSRLVFLYTRQMMAWLLFLSSKSVNKIGVLGLGAGSLARYCMKYTKAEVEVLEWNPSVTAFCQQYFRLPKQERFTITHEDAQLWVKAPEQKNSCEVLLVDLYDYTAQGPVASSLEFYKNCYKTLKDNGILVVNLFGHHPSFTKNIQNINKAFAERTLLFDETEDGNRIVLAFKGAPLIVSKADYYARARVLERFAEIEALLMAKELESQLRHKANTHGLADHEFSV